MLLGFGFVVVLVVVLAIALAADRLPGAARVEAILNRWPVLVELAKRLREGIAVVRRPTTLAGAIGFSVIAWAASICTFLAGAYAVGIELNVAQAALIGSGVALVTIVPSGPGYRRHVRTDRGRQSPRASGSRAIRPLRWPCSCMPRSSW